MYHIYAPFFHTFFLLTIFIIFLLNYRNDVLFYGKGALKEIKKSMFDENKENAFYKDNMANCALNNMDNKNRMENECLYKYDEKRRNRKKETT